MVAHAFSPNTQEEEVGRITEFRASLDYKESSRKARAHRETFSQRKKEKKERREGRKKEESSGTRNRRI